MTPEFSRNHFELLGLPVSYALDAAALERAYRDLQGRVHPDRFASASEAERRVAMQWAARANEAYRTLRHPVDRFDLGDVAAQAVNGIRRVDDHSAPAQAVDHHVELAFAGVVWMDAE